MDIKQVTRMREEIMKLLSDAEVARVSTAESAEPLPPGAEYIDLEDIERGVQRVGELKPSRLDTVLPRSAVEPQTWDRIRELIGT